MPSPQSSLSWMLLPWPSKLTTIDGDVGRMPADSPRTRQDCNICASSCACRFFGTYPLSGSSSSSRHRGGQQQVPATTHYSPTTEESLLWSSHHCPSDSPLSSIFCYCALRRCNSPCLRSAGSFSMAAFKGSPSSPAAAWMPLTKVSWISSCTLAAGVSA